MEREDFLNILRKRQREIYKNYKGLDEIKTSQDRVEAMMNGGRLAEVTHLIEIIESME